MDVFTWFPETWVPLTPGDAEVEGGEQILRPQGQLHAVQVDIHILLGKRHRKRVDLPLGDGELRPQPSVPGHGAVLLTPQTPDVDAVLV